MDKLVETLILGAPNLMVALVVLYLQEKRIKALLEQQREDWRILLQAFLAATTDSDPTKAEVQLISNPPP